MNAALREAIVAELRQVLLARVAEEMADRIVVIVGRAELAESIPPAYTERNGEHLEDIA